MIVNLLKDFENTDIRLLYGTLEQEDFLTRSDIESFDFTLNMRQRHPASHPKKRIIYRRTHYWIVEQQRHTVCHNRLNKLNITIVSIAPCLSPTFLERWKFVCKASKAMAGTTIDIVIIDLWPWNVRVSMYVRQFVCAGGVSVYCCNSMLVVECTSDTILLERRRWMFLNTWCAHVCMCTSKRQWAPCVPGNGGSSSSGCSNSGTYCCSRINCSDNVYTYIHVPNTHTHHTTTKEKSRKSLLDHHPTPPTDHSDCWLWYCGTVLKCWTENKCTNAYHIHVLKLIIKY